MKDAIEFIFGLAKELAWFAIQVILVLMLLGGFAEHFA